MKHQSALERIKERLRSFRARAVDQEAAARVVLTSLGASFFDLEPTELDGLRLGLELAARGHHDMANGALAAYCARRVQALDHREPHERAFDGWMATAEADLDL